MYPEGLRLQDREGYTPFHYALYQHDLAVELMQWHLTFDEIVDCVVDNQVKSAKKKINRSRVPRLAPIRFKAVIEAQCEDLQQLLPRGVLPLVLGYLGFCEPKNKRNQADSLESESSCDSDSDE